MYVDRANRAVRLTKWNVNHHACKPKSREVVNPQGIDKFLWRERRPCSFWTSSVIVALNTASSAPLRSVMYEIVLHVFRAHCPQE